VTSPQDQAKPDIQATAAWLRIALPNVRGGAWPGNHSNQPDEHLRGTPERFLKMLRDLTQPEEFTFTTFETRSNEMVIVKDIDFVSLCAHHIIPFIGKAHVAYVPQGKIAGLSKIARVVKNKAKTLTVQEELTTEIANEIYGHLEPQGLAVVLEAEHMCMTIRGVQSPGTTTITSSMSGVFADHNRLARSEFLQLIGKGHG
jgi:GTP cyclohydrolase IA